MSHFPWSYFLLKILYSAISNYIMSLFWNLCFKYAPDAFACTKQKSLEIGWIKQAPECEVAGARLSVLPFSTFHQALNLSYDAGVVALDSLEWCRRAPSLVRCHRALTSILARLAPPGLSGASGTASLQRPEGGPAAARQGLSYKLLEIHIAINSLINEFPSCYYITPRLALVQHFVGLLHKLWSLK